MRKIDTAKDRLRKEGFLEAAQREKKDFRTLNVIFHKENRVPRPPNHEIFAPAARLSHQGVNMSDYGTVYFCTMVQCT